MIIQRSITHLFTGLTTQPATMENVSIKARNKILHALQKMNFRLCNLFFGVSADTPFGQVKLNEIGSWLARRNKTPSAFMGACSRGNYLDLILFEVMTVNAVQTLLAKD